MRVARFCIELALSIGLPLLIQLWDRGRLERERRARAWNGASWASAVYNFNEYSLLGWFWVTRRWRGLLPGIASSFAVFVVVRIGMDAAVAWTFGLEPPNAVGLLVLYWVGVAVFAPLWLLALFVERRRDRRQS